LERSYPPPSCCGFGGIIKSSHLDLNYVEDVAATDFNVVMNEQLGIVKFKEQQRKEALVRQLNQIVDLAKRAFRSC